jgi:hypothetical protein
MKTKLALNIFLISSISVAANAAANVTMVRHLVPILMP